MNFRGCGSWLLLRKFWTHPLVRFSPEITA